LRILTLPISIARQRWTAPLEASVTGASLYAQEVRLPEAKSPFALTMTGKHLAARKRGKRAWSAYSKRRLVNLGGVDASFNETSPMRASGDGDRICARRIAHLNCRHSRFPESRQQDEHDVQ
jgi:hypothetical protein